MNTERYPELATMRTDMAAQSELYRPTSFWEEASSRINAEICADGVDKFRSLPSPLGFFVPTYGTPGSSLTADQCNGLLDFLRKEHPDAVKPRMALEQFLNGELSARSDYRVMLAADDPSRTPHLHTFSESVAGCPVEYFEFGGRRFSRSSLNYLMGLALLKRHLLVADCFRVVLEIGGGFGTLGEILAHSGIDGLRYIDVDIPPTAFAAQYYLTEVLGAANVATYSQTREQTAIEIDSLPQASVLCSWQIEKLRGQVDLFVNFISFQEMEPHIVGNYLGHVNRLGARWVLLRNMREGKQLRKASGGAGVETPIRSDDYVSMLPAYDLVDRNVQPFGYETVDGYHSELMLLKRKT